MLYGVKMGNQVRMCHSEAKQTLLLDLCNVLGRDSWLSAIPSAPDTWLTLSLENRDSQGAVGCPQEVVWLRVGVPGTQTAHSIPVLVPPLCLF